MSERVKDIALTPKQLQLLIVIHVIEHHSSKLTDDGLLLVQLGLIQRVSGTDIYELTEKGKEFIVCVGISEWLVVNEAKKVRDAFREKVVEMITEEMSNIAEASRGYYKRAIVLINKMKTD